MAQFSRLLDIMDRLRAECPWNRAQTVDSLRPMTVEEVYELSDAVMKKNEEELKKELGDVMLAEEQGKYDVADVLEKVCDKMVFRHPHVFGDVKADDAETVSQNWEMMKTKEKGGNKRVLSGIPDAMPSVLKAHSMQDKARGVGFDWEKKEDVWAKVKEEMGEFEAELRKGDADHSEEELGDFLFAVINAARLYGINPDTALNRACDKFRRRFTYLEEQTLRKGRSLHDMTLAEMDAIWDEGKAKGL